MVQDSEVLGAQRSWPPSAQQHAVKKCWKLFATNGMNVARLNMCHGTHEWHTAVIERIRKLNKLKG